MRALTYFGLIVLVLGATFIAERAQAPVVTTNEQATSQDAPRVPQTQDDTVVAMAEPTPTAPKATIVAVVEEPRTPNEEITYDEAYVEELELAIHKRVNEERKRQGLKTLGYDTLLAHVAAFHSTDMAENNYFEHKDKEGCDSSCRVDDAGYLWRMVGENLFLLKREDHFTPDGASAIVVAGWIGSEGHRKNLFEEDFTEEGVGVVVKGDAIYVTEVLARPR